MGIEQRGSTDQRSQRKLRPGGGAGINKPSSVAKGRTAKRVDQGRPKARAPADGFVRTQHPSLTAPREGSAAPAGTVKAGTLHTADFSAATAGFRRGGPGLAAAGTQLTAAPNGRQDKVQPMRIVRDGYGKERRGCPADRNPSSGPGRLHGPRGQNAHELSGRLFPPRSCPV